MIKEVKGTSIQLNWGFRRHWSLWRVKDKFEDHQRVANQDAITRLKNYSLQLFRIFTEHNINRQMMLCNLSKCGSAHLNTRITQSTYF